MTEKDETIAVENPDGSTTAVDVTKEDMEEMVEMLKEIRELPEWKQKELDRKGKQMMEEMAIEKELEQQKSFWQRIVGWFR